LPELLARLRPPSASEAQLAELAEMLLSAQAPAVPAQTVMRALHWAPQQALARENLAFLCAVDSWAKRERRLAAVRSLAGTPVDFFGQGWREALGDVPDFRYVGNVRHDDIAVLMAHYAAVLNCDPNWAAGVHDRVYTAAAMGVAVLTNDNSALDTAALPADLVHVYDANRPQLGPLAQRAIAAASAPAQLRLDVIGAHGWTNRMARLVAPSRG
jgi:hypothetical protein